MTVGEIVLATLLLIVSGGLGTLGWRHFGEIRTDMRELRRELRGDMGRLGDEVRSDFRHHRGEIRGELQEHRGGLGRGLDELREEMRTGFARVDRRFEQQDLQLAQIRQDLGTLRSDLTHVALAVGVKRPPRASES